jgi:hypothetical protein
MIRLLALLLSLACARAVQAHETTRSYLTLTRSGTDVSLQFRVAFRDIEVAVWMDENLDGDITWAEVEQRREAIASYLQSRITLTAGGACSLTLDHSGASTSGGIDYLDLGFAGQCPDATTPLTLKSDVFLDIDPDHRMFLTAPDGAQSTNAVIRATNPEITLTPGAGGAWNTFAGYLQAGVEHLLGGADHIVFLLVLMLPAVSIGRQQPGVAISRVVAAVTGFTLAHALTLTAGVTALLRPPPSLIECLIALTIVIAAVDNLRPFIPAPRAAVAAFFGLFHGFGFAAALDVLHLQGADFVLALLGFNAGIELAQIGLVLILFPALVMLSHGRGFLLIGSSLGGLAGLGWLVYRVIGLL